LKEDAMTVPDPTGQPDLERPIELTDTPESDKRAKPAPTPKHHPDDGLAGDHPGPLATDFPQE
jgi:hypothetical protein